MQLASLLVGAALSLGPRTVDLQHQEISVRVNPAEHTLLGSTTLTLAPLSDGLPSVTLDAVELNVAEVRVDGQPVKFARLERGVQVPLGGGHRAGQPITIQVTYGARPRRGMVFSDDSGALTAWTPPRRAAVWDWVPTIDAAMDVATFSVRMELPQGTGVGGHGRTVSDEILAGNMHRVRREIERPLAPSELAIAIGRWVKVDLPTGRPGLSASALVAAGSEAETQGVFAQLPEAIGAMERTTGTRFSDGLIQFVILEPGELLQRHHQSAPIIDDVTSRRAWMHALAHHWFGTRIRAADEEGAAVLEGLANELAHVAEASLNPDGAQFWDAEPSDAARAVHAWRGALGDDVFSRFLRVLMEQHDGGALGTEDVQRAYLAVGGQQPVWPSNAPVPEFSVVRTPRGVVFRARSSAPIRTTWRIKSSGTEQVLPLWFDGGSQMISLPLATEPDWIVVDDQAWVWPVPPVVDEAMTVRALRDASLPATRAAAARALRSVESDDATKALVHAARNDAEASVRADAVASLGRFTGAAANETILSALQDADARVQTEAARAACTRGDAAAARTLGRLAGGASALTTREAAGFSLGCHVRQVPDLVARALKLNSPGSRVEAAVMRGIGTVQPSHPALLSALQKGSVAEMQAAADVISAEGSARGPVINALFARLRDPRAGVRAAAARALGRVKAVEARESLRGALRVEAREEVVDAIRASLRQFAH